MMKMKPDVATMAPRDLISLWADNHREKIIMAYTDVVDFLMLDYKGQIQQASDPFPSGSDVIDQITSTMPEGLRRMLKAIEIREYGCDVREIQSQFYDCLKLIKNGQSWKSKVNDLLYTLRQLFDPDTRIAVRNQNLETAGRNYQVRAEKCGEWLRVSFHSAGHMKVLIPEYGEELVEKMSHLVIRACIWEGNCKLR